MGNIFARLPMKAVNYVAACAFLVLGVVFLARAFAWF
jgi:hypothetical protein